MKDRSISVPRGVVIVVVLGLNVLVGALLTSARAADKDPFHIKARYVEGCSCSAPCTCQLTGLEPMCQGVNAISFLGGKYQGVDLAGAKVAFATVPPKWVRLYIDARDARQREAVLAFAKAYTSLFGKIEETKDAKVDIVGEDGKYTVKVDDGKIMSLVTEPVLGGDGKRPLMYSNIHDPLHPTVMQGKTVSGSFNDGGHSFRLKDSNAYFNTGFETKGAL